MWNLFLVQNVSTENPSGETVVKGWFDIIGDILSRRQIANREVQFSIQRENSPQTIRLIKLGEDE